MAWIYLYKGVAEPIAHGVTECDVYAVAETEDEALGKIARVIPGNYKVHNVQVVGELCDFGTDVYAPENM